MYCLYAYYLVKYRAKWKIYHIHFEIIFLNQPDLTELR